MAKSVKIAGVTYSDVPSLVFNLASGSGTARFIDEDDAGGGGIAGLTELYNADVSITYTSTSAGTAKTISGITGIAKYPFVLVSIENADQAAASLKVVKTFTVIANSKYASNTVSVVRYGSMLYYNSSSALTAGSCTSCGIWGYSYTTAGALTIRGRCNTAYTNSLTGTWRVRVYGVNF